MNQDDENWVDPFEEAVDRLNASGLTSRLHLSASVIGGLMDHVVQGPERLRLEYRDTIAERDLERIKLVMEDVPYELAHITTTIDGKHLLDDGTVIGGWTDTTTPRQ